MEKLIDDTGDIWFSCGCKDWRICPEDEKGVLEQPDNTVIDHQCGNIIVYRRKQSLKRYFRNLK